MFIYGRHYRTAHVSHKVLFEKLSRCIPFCVFESRTALATIPVLFDVFGPAD